uniref:Uncharacterized protein n=1 Tax=Amphimedon queenslandica TaxID=400682 RepID=A0A1X7TM55_AMPQE
MAENDKSGMRRSKRGTVRVAYEEIDLFSTSESEEEVRDETDESNFVIRRPEGAANDDGLTKRKVGTSKGTGKTANKATFKSTSKAIRKNTTQDASCESSQTVQETTVCTHNIDTDDSPTKLMTEPRTTKQVKRKRSTKNPESSSKNSKRLLQKKERFKAMESVKDMAIPDILHRLKLTLQDKLPVAEETLSSVFNALLERGPLLISIIEYHKNAFMSCYNDCSTGKDKFLRFQLEWHNRCSVFLLPKNYDTSVIFNVSFEKVDESRFQISRNLDSTPCFFP